MSNCLHSGVKYLIFHAHTVDMIDLPNISCSQTNIDDVTLQAWRPYSNSTKYNIGYMYTLQRHCFNSVHYTVFGLYTVQCCPFCILMDSLVPNVDALSV